MRTLLQILQNFSTLFAIGVLAKLVHKISQSPTYTDCFTFELLVWFSLVGFVLTLANFYYLYKNSTGSIWNGITPLLLLITLVLLAISKHTGLLYIYEEEMGKVLQECEIL